MRNGKDIFKSWGIVIDAMDGKGKAVCLVCDMVVSKKSHFNGRFKSKMYYFCCQDCKSAFEKNPFKFTLG